MTNEKDEYDYAISRIEFIKLPIEVVKMPIDILESALSKASEAMKYELHMHTRRKLVAPDGAPEYLIYYETGDMDAECIGKIKLYKINSDTTEVRQECLGGKRRRSGFDRLVTIWKNTYKNVYPVIIENLAEQIVEETSGADQIVASTKATQSVPLQNEYVQESWEEKVPDANDIVIIKNLRQGLPARDAARSFELEEKTIYNRETILRKKLGNEIVPFRQKWRKRHN